MCAGMPYRTLALHLQMTILDREKMVLKQPFFQYCRFCSTSSCEQCKKSGALSGRRRRSGASLRQRSLGQPFLTKMSSFAAILKWLGWMSFYYSPQRDGCIGNVAMSGALPVCPRGRPGRLSLCHSLAPFLALPFPVLPSLPLFFPPTSSCISSPIFTSPVPSCLALRVHLHLQLHTNAGRRWIRFLRR